MCESVGSVYNSERLKGFCEAASWWLNQYYLMVTVPPSPLIREKKQHTEVLPVCVESNIVGRLYLNKQRHNVCQTSPRELIILIKGPLSQSAGFFILYVLKLKYETRRWSHAEAEEDGTIFHVLDFMMRWFRGALCGYNWVLWGGPSSHSIPTLIERI